MQLRFYQSLTWRDATKYTAEILSKFGMKGCNKVCNPIVPGYKLVKDENGKASDATIFK